MKPDRTLKFTHINGDTLPLAARIQLKDSSGTNDVDSGSTVTLHISDESVVIIAGVSQGSGVWHFSVPSDLTVRTLDCEIQVDDSTYVYTIAKGSIKVEAGIA